MNQTPKNTDELESINQLLKSAISQIEVFREKFEIDSWEDFQLGLAGQHISKAMSSLFLLTHKIGLNESEK